MRILSAEEVDASLDDLALIDRLETLFRIGLRDAARAIITPSRLLAGPESADATLLLMPAWTRGEQGHVGIKLVTVFPDNGKRNLPAIFGQYVLLDGRSGAPLALLDGTVLTRRRTACASGLASRYLSRPEASRLLMIGTGALAPELVRVHAKVRPITEVSIWGRRPAQARRLAAELDQSLPRRSAGGSRCRRSASARRPLPMPTSSPAPRCRRRLWWKVRWLREGQHLDLVGAYRPEMRESDDEAILRARLYVDTRDGALKEAGDIVQPLANGTISEQDIVADLFELARKQREGRSARDATSITLFKSVGAALEDLAAAELALTAR